jgi:hypothetical protein
LGPSGSGACRLGIDRLGRNPNRGLVGMAGTHSPRNRRYWLVPFVHRLWRQHLPRETTLALSRQVKEA